MKLATLVLALILLVLHTYATEGKKVLKTNRIQEKIKVDGHLDEAAWQSAMVGSDFVQTIPAPGVPSSLKTEVQVIYDDNALYIGARLYDDPDSLMNNLCQRDEEPNADWFAVMLDPYNAGINGFGYGVTSCGVQLDVLYGTYMEDGSWNAVWESEVSLAKDHWVVEIMIPYSAVRFPKSEVQKWGINFGREIRRKRERSFWNYFNPAKTPFLSQFGELEGIKDIKSPVRLSVSPYVSAYAEHYDGQTGTTFNGGADLKYGINDAFTVDMTLIPDFGQVQFDNQVLNLSPFEVRFNEYRQFFTEGVQLFNKADIFYTRRIGGDVFDYYKAERELQEGEIVTQNDPNSKLLNATKLSGRTQKGTGIGILNGIVGQSLATITDTLTGNTREVETNPITNYNVFVLDQNLKHNSNIGIINTNVMRSGGAYEANVTAIDYNGFNKKQNYNFYGNATLSQIMEGSNNQLGHSLFAGVTNVAGNLRWDMDYEEISDTYDHNDLGYLYNNNFREITSAVYYNIYEPFWRLNSMWSSVNLSYTRLYNPDVFTDFRIDWNVGGTFKNFLSTGIWGNFRPTNTYDYFEPRVWGRYYEDSRGYTVGGWISSDYSKKFALDMRGFFLNKEEDGRYTYELVVEPRFVINDKFNMNYSIGQHQMYNAEKAALDLNWNVAMDGDDPVFCTRDQLTITNSINANYIFNNRMGVSFRLRHYWAKVKYNEFFRLNLDGTYGDTEYNGLDADGNSLHNNSYNAFTIDMAYQWVFAPGSQVSIVWKNSLFDFSQNVDLTYFDNVDNLTNLPATNSLSIKVLYYLDYWMLKKKKN